MNNNYRFIAFCFLLLSALPLWSQRYALGLRLGDPLGLTFKQYKGSKALEISLGRTGFGYRDDWYGKRFDRWYADRDFDYDDYVYNGYKRGTPIALQLHLLQHRGVDRRAKSGLSGLEWYYGLGAQVQFNRYAYAYRYKIRGSNEWVHVDDDRVVNIDFGIDGVIGLEYTFRDAPVSLFTDLTLYMELLDDPFRFWLQGGVGARVRF